jgi:crotonobetainyl-CoA:carnitine CoA-transferase CaiB-like acyl-CoA transferase
MAPWQGDGLRVVELGGGIAAAFGARLLADAGADVIKVEPPEGDPARRLGPFPDDQPHPERSGMFRYLNHGKRGVVLDLEQPTEVERLHRLLATADVVVENLGAGVFDRLTAGRELPQRLVVCSISPFGQEGPKAGYLGSELCAYASGGMMHQTGGADRPPVKQGLHQAEHLAGVNAAAASIACALHARRTEVGRRIDVSLQETVALTIFPALNVYTHTGAVVKRSPAALPQLMTSQAMRAADGWIMPSDAGIDVWWDAFAAYLERPELLEPPFDTSAGRRAAHEAVDRITGEAFRERTKLDLFHTGQQWGLTMASIQSPDEIAACPQLAERDFWIDDQHAEGGALRMPGPVPRFGRAGELSTRPAPHLGEHTAEVVASLEEPPPRPRPAPAAVAADALPLEGVRILELGMVFVLPLAITPLAALGADVIKVEAESRPDSVRWGPQPGNELRPEYWNHSGNFHHLNRSKRGIAVDLRTPEGRDLVLRLVAESDVVAENFTPRVLEHLGLDYEQLRAVNPRIILLSSSGFGQTGPWRNYKAYGPITEAVDGLMHLTGYPDGPPTRAGAGGWGVAFTDVAGAYYGTYSILAALERRDRTGEGAWLDLSHYEAGVATVPEALLDFELNGRVLGRAGNRDAHRCPQGAYPCAGDDRWIAISVATDAQFAALAQTLALEGAARDRFATIEARRADEEELDALIAGATRSWDTRDLEQALQSAGVEATVVANVREVWTDPQLRHRGFAQLSPEPSYAPELGPRAFPRAAWLIDGLGLPSRSAPAFGEHTREVLTQVLGLEPRAIDALYASGVVAEAPRQGLVNPRPLELEEALASGRLEEIDAAYRERFLDLAVE